MANISCKCGYIFSDGQIPCPHEHVLLSDVGVEDLASEVVSILERGGDIEAELAFVISNHGVTVYKCSKCKRLILFENGINERAVFYAKEE